MSQDKDSKAEISKTENLLHKTIKKVGDDIIQMRFNTAISSLMILLNALEDEDKISKRHFEIFLLLLAPFAPHVSEELWEKMGNKDSIHIQDWPAFDKALIEESDVTLAVQINGKTRASMKVRKDQKEGEIQEMAKTLPDIQKWLNKGLIKRVIYVKNRVINILVDENK